jgi:phage-related protein
MRLISFAIYLVLILSIILAAAEVHDSNDELDQAFQEMEDGVKEVSDAVVDVVQDYQPEIDAAFAAVQKAEDTIVEVVQGVADAVVDAVPTEIKEEVKELLGDAQELLKTTKENIEPIVNDALSQANTILNTVIDKIQQTVDAVGKTAYNKEGTGILNRKEVTSVLKTVVSQWRKLFSTVASLIKKFFGRRK